MSHDPGDRWRHPGPGQKDLARTPYRSEAEVHGEGEFRFHGLDQVGARIGTGLALAGFWIALAIVVAALLLR